jgi:MFS family permease
VVVFCLFIIGSIVGILGHIGWGILIILIASLLCLILIPLTLENLNTEITEQIKNVDTAESIRIKDFFIGYGLLLKLKRKYGTRKAMVIYFVLFISFMVIVAFLTFYLIENLILINDRWYHGGHWLYPGIGSLIGGSIGVYFNARRVIKNSEKLSTKPRFCTNCGASVVPDAIFCTNCGKQLINKT